MVDPLVGFRCLLKISKDVTVVAITSYLLYKLYVKIYWDRYRLVGKVSDILIYPIVSCGALQVSDAQCSPDGLVSHSFKDKGLVLCIKNKYPHPMLAYGEYRQISFRDELKVKTEYAPESFVLTASEGSSVRINPSQIKDTQDAGTVQFVCVRSIYRGRKIKDPDLLNWFVKLLSPKEEIQILSRDRVLWKKVEGRTELGLITVMNGESIVTAFQDHPSNIGSKINTSYRVFAPNIVISGCRPFVESKWKSIRIGSRIVGEIISPDIKVVDDEHAEMYTNNAVNMGQPAEAFEDTEQIQFMCGMDKYKAMGLHIKLKSTGEITVGDPVYAVCKHPTTFRENVRYFVELMPYFVIRTLGFIPGLAGLYISTIFSGALSTLSSGINALTANTVEDLLHPVLRKFRESTVTGISKFIVVLYGVTTIGLAYMIKEVQGPMTQITVVAMGATGGPTLGMFSLGAIFPQGNYVGASIGCLAGLAFCLWLNVAKFTYGARTPTLPLGPTDTCQVHPSLADAGDGFFNEMLLRDDSPFFNRSLNATGNNGTVSSLVVTPSPAKPIDSDNIFGETFHLYDISYLWVPVLGFLISLFLGLIISKIYELVSGVRKRPKPEYIYPFMRRIWYKDDELVSKKDKELEDRFILDEKLLESDCHVSA